MARSTKGMSDGRLRKDGRLNIKGYFSGRTTRDPHHHGTRRLAMIALIPGSRPIASIPAISAMLACEETERAELAVVGIAISRSISTSKCGRGIQQNLSGNRQSRNCLNSSTVSDHHRRILVL
jgi:hypothetical protein